MKNWQRLREEIRHNVANLCQFERATLPGTRMLKPICYKMSRTRELVACLLEESMGTYNRTYLSMKKLAANIGPSHLVHLHWTL